MSDAEKLKELQDHYNQMKDEKSKCSDRFDKIGKLVNLTDVDSQTVNEGQEVANYVNDSTAYQAMIQSGRSFVGILWNGKGTFKFLPPNDMKDDPEDDFDEDLLKFYERATDIVINQMDDSDAGFSKALERYGNAYQSVGNGGIGVHLNTEYLEDNADNALEFRFYGVNNSVIDEGRGGIIEYIFSDYEWTVAKLVRTFAFVGDVLDKKVYEKLPESWRKAYEAKQYTEKFKFVYAFQPNEEFKRGKKGKKGARYVGYYFSNDDNCLFHTEYYAKRQICFVRDILMNDEIYGRAQGTVLLPAIEMLNYIMGTAIENIEKQTDPAFGILAGLLQNDKVIDTSAGAATVVNPIDLQGNTPTFQLQNIGDISGLVNFLLPVLREEIRQGFDVDLLSEVNMTKDMTAQEFLGRLKLRAEGLRNRLKTNMENLLKPLIEASAYLCVFAKAIDGVPDEVMKRIESGKKWYEIKFMNDLGRLTNVDLIDGINKLLMIGAQLIQIDPIIGRKFNCESILTKVNDYLANDESLLLKDTEFKLIRQAYEQAQIQAAQTEQNNMDSQTLKNVAESEKDDGKDNKQFSW